MLIMSQYDHNYTIIYVNYVQYDHNYTIIYVNYVQYDHNYTIMEQADITEHLLHQLEVPRVHILAHDYGDTVAQELIAR